MGPLETLSILQPQCFLQDMLNHQVRTLKNHYKARWAVLRHNQKHDQKILSINDLFVLKNLLPGDTLCYNCLGSMYKNIIPNLSIDIDNKYSNLVLINNLEFKYKTLDQIAEYLESLANMVLMSKGRLILSFEHRFLIYNRVDQSINTALTTWLSKLKKFKLITMVSKLGTASPGYGDYFFCLEYL